MSTNTIANEKRLAVRVTVEIGDGENEDAAGLSTGPLEPKATSYGVITANRMSSSDFPQNEVSEMAAKVYMTALANLKRQSEKGT